MKRAVLRFAVLVACGVFAGTLDAQRADFKIVVIEGEASTNIIQPRTAVAPVIEVRDKNDQPVAGAVVTFGIRRGGAHFANGARTLIATTDASGRAVGAGLTVTSKGTLQLTVSARVQGQLVSATITQSNVVTAAQAATSTGAASGSGAAAGGGVGAGATAAVAAGGSATGGAGGGLSALAIGGIAAGAGGGALATVVATSSDDSSSSTDPTNPMAVVYSGQYSADALVTITTAFVVNPVVCVSNRTATGLLRLTVTVASNDIVTGTGQTSMLFTPVSESGCPFQPGAGLAAFEDVASGTRGALGFTAHTPANGTSFYGPVTGDATLTFAGSLSGGVITGTMVFSQSVSGTSDGSNGRPAGAPITGNASVSIPVTLR